LLSALVNQLFAHSSNSVIDLPHSEIVRVSHLRFQLWSFRFQLQTTTFDKTMDTLPTYTRSQLALRNGQDKPEVWIAYQGLIYDVSQSRLWMKGQHYEHWAGQDLTAELADAPHDDWVFEHFDPIGRLM